MNTPFDPIADFRPDGYGLDDERRARLRSRVLDAIPDDPPAGVTTLVSARRTTASSTSVDDHDELAGLLVPEPLSVGDRRRPTRSHQSGRGANGRRLLVAAAVAVALGLLAVMVGNSRSGDRQVGTLDRKPVTLDEMATRASNLPDRPLGAGEYQSFVKHLATRSAEGGYDIFVDEYWYASDDTGATRNTEQERPAGRPNGSERVVAANPLRARSEPCSTGCFGPFVYDGLRAAPTDAQGLLDTVKALSPSEPDWSVAEQLATIGALTTTPPAVRVAVFRALVDLGFRPIGTVTDPLDRAGVAFSLITAERNETIVFDLDSTATLAFWGADPAAPRDWGSADGWTAFSDASITGPPG